MKRKGYLQFQLLAALVLVAATEIASADGTEALGMPSIPLAAGSGFAVGGTGLMGVPQPATIFVAVPQNAVVQQVLLYWVSEHYPQTGPDATAVVNGVEVAGDAVGGPTNFFSVVYFETFRADITDLGLVGPGGNALEISGLESSFRTTGAGVLVLYDDGTGRELQLLDGQDLAYWRLDPPLDTTAPVVFTFEPASHDRVAEVPVLVGSVGDARPNVTEIISGGLTQRFTNLFTSLDGPEWDSQVLEVLVPAGADFVSMQLLSESDGTDLNPASMTWCVAGLALTPPQEEDCGPCDGKVAQLTLQYLGDATDASIEVKQKKEGKTATAFSGVVQPGDLFTVNGVDKHGTLGPEISVFVNGVLNAKIHTSCSQPIGPGLVRGDFLVVEGYSRNGGLLCPLDEPEDPPVSGQYCDEGKPRKLTMVYTGESCAASDHAQEPGKVICSGDPALMGVVRIIATDKDDPSHDKARIFFDGEVALGQAFDIDADNTDLARLRGDTRVFIYDIDGNLLQFVQFHTSCSQPLREGDQFGALQLAGFVAEQDVKADLLEEMAVGKPQLVLGCGENNGRVPGAWGDLLVALAAVALLAVWRRVSAARAQG